MEAQRHVEHRHLRPGDSIVDTVGHPAVDGRLTAETNGVVTVLVGAGATVTWDLVDAATVVGGQPTVGRSTLRSIGERLHEAGVTLEVTEGHRSLLQVGATSSLLGRLLFGSPTVRPRAPVQLLRLARRARR